MAVEFRDYYTTLGVGRDAGEDEIKKAFRTLARKYHPDVAKDKAGAEDRFKEINEAYEVLSDPRKRKLYDELGANWKQGAAPPPPPPRGGAHTRRAPGGGGYQEFHFGGTGYSDFFEQFFGRGGRYGFSDYGGAYSEEEPGQPQGFKGGDIEGEILVTLEEITNGSQRTISLQHADPKTGKGETQTFRVKIPVGIREDQLIRLPGKGEPGTDGQPAGDLYLRVRYAAHPYYRVSGADLYFDLDLAPWEAVLGTSVTVPTLTGKVQVKIPAGKNTGDQLRVRGQGLPRGQEGTRGDLYVVIQIQVPQQLSNEERSLWENLSRISPFNPRSK